VDGGHKPSSTLKFLYPLKSFQTNQTNIFFNLQKQIKKSRTDAASLAFTVSYSIKKNLSDWQYIF
jgi:hypothetical protein